MKQVKTLIFTTERNHEWLKAHEGEIRETLRKTKNADIATFEYRFADIVKPETYTGKDGKVRISHKWFDNTFTAQARQLGFDTAVFHFTRDKRTEWKLHPTINGTYWRDKDKELEFWLCADEGQKTTSRQQYDISQYVRVFLHEYGHGFVHFYHPDRRPDVHEWDYQKRDIKGLFETLELPKGEPLFIDYRYKMNNYWKGNDPASIVLHTTAGYGVEGAVQTLLARGLSYNYIIDDGQVYHLVDWVNSAWHAGVVRQPNLRARTFFNGVNPNKKSVGIAFTYPRTGDIAELSEADVNAAVKLIKMIGREADQRYNADNIFYHQEITIDKPKIVKGYRDQVLDGLVGDKDEKDAGENTRLKLLIQLLKLKIQLLLLRNKK